MRIGNTETCKHCGTKNTIKIIKREKTKKELEYEQMQMIRHQVNDVFTEKIRDKFKNKPVLVLKPINELYPENNRYKCEKCGKSGSREEMYASITLTPLTQEEYEKEIAEIEERFNH